MKTSVIVKIALLMQDAHKPWRTPTGSTAVLNFTGPGLSTEVQFKKELYFLRVFMKYIYIYTYISVGARGSLRLIHVFKYYLYMGPTVYEYHLLCSIWSPRVRVPGYWYVIQISLSI